MSNRPTILHIIESFGRGGAETMLVATLRQLEEYNNVVVTLYADNHFGEAVPGDKHICLNVRSVAYLPIAAMRLRKIIKDNDVSLVHSHLYWPTFISRFATPKRIPLITTIHTSIAYTKDHKKWYIRFLDRFSYNFRKSIIIAVANTAMEQYFSVLKIKPYKAHLLYTFVDTSIFKDAERKETNNPIFKIMTIGTLRYPKNHEYLIEAMEQLKKENIQLDIYGSGPLQTPLEEQIERTGANVRLMGQVADLQRVISQYDLYMMASVFEGFSLSVLEAMAMEMPLLLSNIPSFKEQCEDVAEYFDLDEVKDLSSKITMLANDRSKLAQMGKAAKERLVNNFTLDHHMKGLRAIYTEALENK